MPSSSPDRRGRAPPRSAASRSPTAIWYSARSAASRARCRPSQRPRASAGPLTAPASIARNSVAISTAASAASRPLLAGPAAARSTACSTESVVSTPKAIGTPVAAAASLMPCAAAEAMYSKCGVPPRITQPRQTTAAGRRCVADVAGRGGDLERARHPHHVDVRVGHARFGQRLARAGEQPRGDEVVPARDDDGEPGAPAPRSALEGRHTAIAPSTPPCASRGTRACLRACRRSTATRPNSVASRCCASASGISAPWCTASRM